MTLGPFRYGEKGARGIEGDHILLRNRCLPNLHLFITRHNLPNTCKAFSVLICRYMLLRIGMA